METSNLWAFKKFEMDFIDLRNYQNFMEDYLIQAKCKFEASTKETIANYDDIDYEHVLNNMAERHYEIVLLYPHQFRASFLIHIMSFIESALRKICTDYENRNHIQIPFSRDKGKSDFQKSQRFLMEEAKIELSNMKEWNFINSVRKIRNKLVHNQGIVCDSDNDFGEIEMFIEHYDFISFENKIIHGYVNQSHPQKLIIHKREMNDFLINSAENFCDELLEKLGL